MITAYIGLGANLNSPHAQIVQAIDELSRLPDSQRLAVSSLYRSAPMLLPDQISEQPQADYINAVAKLATTLAPHVLLDELQALEQAHGRQRGGLRWASRTLDLDILLYENQEINDERLQVPHPGIAARNFVLYPLAEIASKEIDIPGRGKLADLLNRCSSQGLEKITS